MRPVILSMGGDSKLGARKDNRDGLQLAMINTRAVAKKCTEALAGNVQSVPADCWHAQATIDRDMVATHLISKLAVMCRKINLQIIQPRLPIEFAFFAPSTSFIVPSDHVVAAMRELISNGSFHVHEGYIAIGKHPDSESFEQQIAAVQAVANEIIDSNP